MHGDLFSPRLYPCSKTWHLQLSINGEHLFQDCLGRVNQALVVRALLGCQQEVCLCVFEYLYGGDQCKFFNMYLCVYAHMYVSVCMCMCVCVYVRVCEYVRACACSCVYVRVLESVYPFMCACG